MQVASLLTSELQLGQQLNQSVESGEKANFALLLSMLSKDVSEQAQFHFDQTEPAAKESPSLREQFDLPREQPLNGNAADELHSLAVSRMVQEEGVLAARLNHCLNPEALNFSLDKQHNIDTQVFDNLDPHAAAKLAGQKVRPQLQPINLNAVIKAQQSYSAQLIA